MGGINDVVEIEDDEIPAVSVKGARAGKRRRLGNRCKLYPRTRRKPVRSPQSNQDGDGRSPDQSDVTGSCSDVYLPPESQKEKGAFCSSPLESQKGKGPLKTIGSDAKRKSKKFIPDLADEEKVSQLIKDEVDLQVCNVQFGGFNCDVSEGQKSCQAIAASRKAGRKRLAADDQNEGQGSRVATKGVVLGIRGDTIGSDVSASVPRKRGGARRAAQKGSETGREKKEKKTRVANRADKEQGTQPIAMDLGQEICSVDFNAEELAVRRNSACQAAEEQKGSPTRSVRGECEKDVKKMCELDDKQGSRPVERDVGQEIHIGDFNAEGLGGRNGACQAVEAREDSAPRSTRGERKKEKQTRAAREADGVHDSHPRERDIGEEIRGGDFRAEGLAGRNDACQAVEAREDSAARSMRGERKKEKKTRVAREAGDGHGSHPRERNVGEEICGGDLNAEELDRRTKDACQAEDAQKGSATGGMRRETAERGRKRSLADNGDDGHSRHHRKRNIGHVRCTSRTASIANSDVVVGQKESGEQGKNAWKRSMESNTEGEKSRFRKKRDVGQEVSANEIRGVVLNGGTEDGSEEQMENEGKSNAKAEKSGSRKKRDGGQEAYANEIRGVVLDGSAEARADKITGVVFDALADEAHAAQAVEMRNGIGGGQVTREPGKRESERPVPSHTDGQQSSHRRKRDVIGPSDEMNATDSDVLAVRKNIVVSRDIDQAPRNLASIGIAMAADQGVAALADEGSVASEARDEEEAQSVVRAVEGEGGVSDRVPTCSPCHASRGTTGVLVKKGAFKLASAPKEVVLNEVDEDAGGQDAAIFMLPKGTTDPKPMSASSRQFVGDGDMPDSHVNDGAVTGKSFESARKRRPLQDVQNLMSNGSHAIPVGNNMAGAANSEDATPEPMSTDTANHVMPCSLMFAKLAASIKPGPVPATVMQEASSGPSKVGLVSVEKADGPNTREPCMGGALGCAGPVVSPKSQSRPRRKNMSVTNHKVPHLLEDDSINGPSREDLIRDLVASATSKMMKFPFFQAARHCSGEEGSAAFNKSKDLSCTHCSQRVVESHRLAAALDSVDAKWRLAEKDNLDSFDHLIENQKKCVMEYGEAERKHAAFYREEYNKLIQAVKQKEQESGTLSNVRKENIRLKELIGVRELKITEQQETIQDQQDTIDGLLRKIGSLEQEKPAAAGVALQVSVQAADATAVALDRAATEVKDDRLECIDVAGPPDNSCHLPLDGREDRLSRGHPAPVDEYIQVHPKLLSLLQNVLGCEFDYEPTENEPRQLLLTLTSTGFRFALEEVEDEYGETLQYHHISNGSLARDEVHELLRTTFRVHPRTGPSILGLLLPLCEKVDMIPQP